MDDIITYRCARCGECLDSHLENHICNPNAVREYMKKKTFTVENDKLLDTPVTSKDSKPCRCPVCEGNGLVPNGFYNQTSGNWSGTDTTPETCRTCNGRGMVWK